MALLKNVLGLDPGSHSVKAVELRQSLRSVEPVQMRLEPRDPRWDAEEDGGAEAFRRFAALHQLPLDHVVAALPGDRIASRRLEFPFRDQKRLAAAVPFEVESATPFELDEVMVAWEVAAGERHHAVVHTLLAPREEVGASLAGFAAWGCVPRVLEAEGAVLANLSALFPLESPTLLVDLGHRKTTLCLVVDGHPAMTRTLPLGGAALTEALAKDRHWSLEDAERAKCEEGLFQPGFDSASPQALGLLDRLARELARSLEGAEPLIGGSASDALGGITLVGGGAALHRLDEYLAERTGVPTARLRAPADSPAAAVVPHGDPALFGPALALALRGTVLARTRIDFRQGEYAYRSDYRRYFSREMRPLAGWGLAVAALFGVQAWAGGSVEAGRAESLRGQIGSLYAGAFPGQAVPARPVAAMRGALADARTRADFLGLYGTGSALELLAELSRRVPGDLSVRFEEVSIDRTQIRIQVSSEGFEAADRLERVLAQSPPFQSAKAGEVTTDRRSSRRSFPLTISLEPPGEAP